MSADLPRVVRDLSDVAYHADKTSLSSSGARQILQSPARFRHDQDHPQPPRDVFDLGHAAHSKILGVGAPIAVIDADDKRGKKWSEPAEAARTQGKVPLLRKDAEAVDAMAEAVLKHPLAAALLEQGEPELSAYGEHGLTGVTMRARPDWLRPGYVVDLKTTTNADPHAFGKTAADYGYHLQAAWYLDVLQVNGLADPDTRFLFVLVEKTAPYLPSVVELDDEAIRVGRDQYERAVRLYKHCTDTGTWPGYPDDAPVVSLPAWYLRTHDLQEI